MRRILLHLHCLSALLCASAAADKSAGPGFAVIELFTSEGCSSCPPADALLAKLIAESADRPVYALAFHVDYWNDLGWKDPFSRAEFTSRQKRYAGILGAGVYTPQMIVNGKDQFIGSDGAAARKAVAAALTRNTHVTVALEARPLGADGILRADYRVAGASVGEVLNLALVETGITVPVRRGENGGRTLAHENVVRAFASLTPGRDGAGTARLEWPEGLRAEKARLIAYVQDADGWEIRGGAETGLGAGSGGARRAGE